MKYLSVVLFIFILTFAFLSCENIPITNTTDDNTQERPESSENPPVTTNNPPITTNNDEDADDDGILDDVDNCILISNGNQLDTDTDSLGDACDNDDDGDGVLDSEDNCPLTVNEDQLDLDENSVGDDCEDVEEEEDVEEDIEEEEDIEQDDIGEVLEDTPDLEPEEDPPPPPTPEEDDAEDAETENVLMPYNTYNGTYLKITDTCNDVLVPFDSFYDPSIIISFSDIIFTSGFSADNFELTNYSTGTATYVSMSGGFPIYNINYFIGDYDLITEWLVSRGIWEFDSGIGHATIQSHIAYCWFMPLTQTNGITATDWLLGICQRNEVNCTIQYAK